MTGRLREPTHGTKKNYKKEKPTKSKKPTNVSCQTRKGCSGQYDVCTTAKVTVQTVEFTNFNGNLMPDQTLVQQYAKCKLKPHMLHS